MTSNVIMCLSQNGTIKSFSMDHSSLHKYFGNSKTLEFCGSIEQYYAVAICEHSTQTENTNQINFYSKHYPCYFTQVYGDILLVGSNEEGLACDLNVFEIQSLLNHL